MLYSINVITLELQRNTSTVAECRDALDSLLEAVEEERNIRAAPLHGCKLDGKYARLSSTFVEYAAFEDGVTKIQNGETKKLSKVEKEAVKHLRRASNDEEIKHVATSSLSIHERLAKRRKLKGQLDEYVNRDFILGSVAEAERVWSVAKYILSEHRSSLTPRMFEALIFLRYNERFWYTGLDAKAVGKVEARSDE